MNYELKFGEGKIIADECGVSTNTFKKAIKGEINTPIAKLIRMHTDIVVRQREDRVNTVNRLLKDLKEKKK
jgi:hypothetical protein